MAGELENEIRRVFPVIEEIADMRIKQTVYRAWGRGISECGFGCIEHIPFSPELPGCRLVDHIRWVMDAALRLAELAEKGMGVSVNRDLLIAAVLLHDLGKAYEFRKDDENYVKSSIGKQFMHGFWGAHVSLVEGASQELAHLISTHCHVSPVEPQLIEGVILHYADFAHADLLRFQQNLEPYLK